MRTPTDALRSIARYSAIALGGDWEVRLSSELGTFNRPYARVTQVPSIQMLTPRWNLTKYIASYSIVAYPSQMADADASHIEALRVADLFWVALAGPGVGTPVIRAPADGSRGRPSRIPLYDYDGIALDGPQAFADETKRDSRDFLHMEGPPEVVVANDPDDETMYSVAANIRMSWLRSAAVPSTAPTLQSIEAGAQANG